MIIAAYKDALEVCDPLKEEKKPPKSVNIKKARRARARARGRAAGRPRRPSSRPRPTSHCPPPASSAAPAAILSHLQLYLKPQIRRGREP